MVDVWETCLTANLRGIVVERVRLNTWGQHSASKNERVVRHAVMHGLEMVALTKKLGGFAGSGRIEDVEIYIENDQDGEN